MKLMQCFAACLTLCVGSLPSVVSAQDTETLYVSVECMKSTNMDYESVEQDIWLPMHQHLVDQGARASWALYEVLFGDRSKCDFYTVTTLRGEEQLNAAPDYRAAFEAAHPDAGFERAMSRTQASRERVSTQLWVRVDATEIRKHRFMTVNFMKASDADVYERMESRVFKPGHQALLESGHRAGWGLYTLVAPLGTAVPYNYSTVDFATHLNPVPMAEAMMAANPDRDLDEMQDLLGLREQVLSEVWVLVATTD